MRLIKRLIKLIIAAQIEIKHFNEWPISTSSTFLSTSSTFAGLTTLFNFPATFRLMHGEKHEYFYRHSTDTQLISPGKINHCTM